VFVYPQYTFDAADDATGHSTHSTAHNRPDRSRRMMADARPFPRPLADTLSPRRQRRCEKGYDASSHRRPHFHNLSPI
jgi:hypothetical protein